ncbi:MAG: YidC/Oxa1 family insertase periplasmic-domain containing protein [Bacteroidetes bacterium]|nr:YidC/Oxa1 family insertase periplasmic-domain containing protein [Bacteroidota bacterium]
MDKNSLIGMLLIGGIILAYLTYISPSEEDMERARVIKDSLEQAKINSTQVDQDTSNINDESVEITGEETPTTQFETSPVVENKYYTIENDLIKVTISSLGGRISSVELKNFKTFDTLPLILFDEQHSKFGLKFFVDNKRITTNELQFETNGSSFEVSENDSKTLSMRYYASESEYVEYKYTLEGNSYEVGTDINLVGINNLVASNIVDIDLDWEVTIFPLEKNSKDERDRYSQIYYKYTGGDVEYSSESSPS